VKVIVNSPPETHKLAMQLASILLPGDVISLEGDLGAGKTHFAKGIGAGLGIDPALITSPTFTLINEYQGKYPLYHFDVYRLQPQELEDLGCEEYFYGRGVCLVEWGNNVKDYLPQNYLRIVMHKTGLTQREINFYAYGERYQKLLSQLEAVINNDSHGN